ncbi:hypothetical protein HMI56_001623, partial [Coelomomyces lativittatus]
MPSASFLQKLDVAAHSQLLSNTPTSSPTSWLKNLSDFFNFQQHDHVFFDLLTIYDSPHSLIFYTDGSLHLSPPNLPVAQAGVFCLQPPVSFNFSLPPGNHSSLCSELWGVLLSLADSPPSSGIVIFCDSRNITQSFQNLVHTSPHTIFHSPCSIKCLLLKHILQHRNISLQIHWIK